MTAKKVLILEYTSKYSASSFSQEGNSISAKNVKCITIPNAQNMKPFILKNDLPDVKAGAKVEWDTNNSCYSIERPKGRYFFDKDVVENTPEWFTPAVEKNSLDEIAGDTQKRMDAAPTLEMETVILKEGFTRYHKSEMNNTLDEIIKQLKDGTSLDQATSIIKNHIVKNES